MGTERPALRRQPADLLRSWRPLQRGQGERLPLSSRRAVAIAMARPDGDLAVQLLAGGARRRNPAAKRGAASPATIRPEQSDLSWLSSCLASFQGVRRALIVTLQLPCSFVATWWPKSLPRQLVLISDGMGDDTSDHLETAALQAEVDRLKALAVAPSSAQQLPFDGCAQQFQLLD